MEQLAYKPRQAAVVMNISLSKVYAAIAKGELKATHKSSRLTLITVEAIKEYLNAA